MILAGVPSHVANLVAYSNGVNLSSAAVALMVIVLVTVVTSIFIARRFKNAGNHTSTLSETFTYVFSAGKVNVSTGDVPLQTNEAYCTVTIGRAPMKRNKAYESVLRPETNTQNTPLSPVYETVH